MAQGVKGFAAKTEDPSLIPPGPRKPLDTEANSPMSNSPESPSLSKTDAPPGAFDEPRRQCLLKQSKEAHLFCSQNEQEPGTREPVLLHPRACPPAQACCQDTKPASLGPSPLQPGSSEGVHSRFYTKEMPKATLQLEDPNLNPRTQHKKQDMWCL